MKRLAFFAVVVGCTAVDVPRPTLVDANRANIPLVRLEDGRAVYLDKCTTCHTAIAPRDILAGDWPGHVTNMAERSKISAAEQAIIVDYLVTVAPPGQTPIPGITTTPTVGPAPMAPTAATPAADPAPAP